MCLITEQKKAIRTKEDMIVWKNVREEYNGAVSSVYRTFEWKEGEVYKTRMDLSQDPICYDFDVRREYGLIYIPNPSLQTTLSALNLKAIGRGFHAFMDIDRADDSEPIRQFLIPAGSLVYKDKTGLIVSNQIMMLPK